MKFFPEKEIPEERNLRMTDAELAAIRERRAKITPGPWKISTMKDEPDHYIVLSMSAEPGQNGICSLWQSGWLSGDLKLHPGNGEFIANAPTDMDKLLAEIDRLKNCLLGADEFKREMLREHEREREHWKFVMDEQRRIDQNALRKALDEKE